MKIKRLTIMLICLLLMGSLSACSGKENEDIINNVVSDQSSRQSTKSSTSSSFSSSFSSTTISTTSSEKEDVHPEVKELVDDFLEANRKYVEAQNDYNAFEKRYGGFDNIPPSQYQTAIKKLNDVKEKAQAAQVLAEKIANLESTYSNLNHTDLEYCQKAIEIMRNN